jgi:hypothetical protein
MHGIIARDTKSKARKITTRESQFVPLPHDIAGRPPIAHRNTPANFDFLSPYEFALACGSLILAWRQIKQEQHKLAFAAGRHGIELEQKYLDDYQAKWHKTKAARARDEKAEAPTRRHAFNHSSITNLAHGFSGLKKPAVKGPRAKQRAGRHHYLQTRLQLERDHVVPEVIVCDVTRQQLLMISGLFARGRHRQNLPHGLDRLLQPTADKPPLLRSWSVLDNGKLRLEVDSQWTPRGFVKVPMPLPLKPAALALYVWLRSLGKSVYNKPRKGGTQYKTLCRLLGIKKGTRGQAVRDLYNALDIVNKHGREQYDASVQEGEVILRRVKSKKASQQVEFNDEDEFDDDDDDDELEHADAMKWENRA